MAKEGRNDLMPEARMRLLKAVAIVLALLVVVPGADAVGGFLTASRSIEASGTGLDLGAFFAAGDAYAALDSLEGSVTQDGVEVPDAFSDEVGVLPHARDVRVSGDGAVVGYVIAGDSDEVAARVQERMRESGWTAVSLGAAEGATFVKSSGSYRWSLITCTQVGSSVSVVARCMAE